MKMPPSIRNPKLDTTVRPGENVVPRMDHTMPTTNNITRTLAGVGAAG